MTLKWQDLDCFSNNTSSSEAIWFFINAEYTFAEFKKACWHTDCKHRVRQLERMGYTKAEDLIAKWFTEHGYDVTMYVAEAKRPQRYVVE